nr:malate dehydrogenase [Verrucomicrobium spinosum]
MGLDSMIELMMDGADGQIGYSLLFRIASCSMFGPDQPVALRLIEIEPALPTLGGVVMELDDCAFPLVHSITPTSDLNEGFRGVNWALLVGSVPRKVGMERKDLLNINGKIFVGQGQAIAKNAASDVRVLVVGNHSATQYPDFTNAKIKGQAVTEVISDQAWLEGEFITTVQQRGAAIIKARGSSSAASAANAVVDTVKSLVTPTPAGDWTSVAVCSDGSYGVEKDIITSFPIRTDGSKWEIVQGVSVSEFSQGKIDATVNELKEERDAVKELGLI